MNYLETIETIQTWLTPPILFCIVNLMILTIFLLKPHENLKKLTEPQRLSQLINVPKLFQRVLSSRSIYRSENQPVHHDTYYAPNQEPVHEHYMKERNSEPVLEETKPVHEEIRGIAHAEPVHEGKKISHVRSKSEMVRKKPVKKVLRKSISEKITEETTSQGDEAVDGKADDFISKFRNALKLQRMDSVNLEYSNMMNRGT